MQWMNAARSACRCASSTRKPAKKSPTRAHRVKAAMIAARAAIVARAVMVAIAARAVMVVDVTIVGLAAMGAAMTGPRAAMIGAHALNVHRVKTRRKAAACPIS